MLAALPVPAARIVPGLRSQAVRAVTDVGGNIAEGCAAASRAEFVTYVETAVGSLNELERRMTTAHRAGVTTAETHARIAALIILLRRMLLALRRTLQRHIAEDRHRARDPAPDSRPATPDAVNPSRSVEPPTL